MTRIGKHTGQLTEGYTYLGVVDSSARSTSEIAAMRPMRLRDGGFDNVGRRGFMI